MRARGSVTEWKRRGVFQVNVGLWLISAPSVVRVVDSVFVDDGTMKY